MQKQSMEKAIEEIFQKDPRYPRDAYYFLREAIDFTIKQYRKNAIGPARHIQAKELLDGFRAYTLQQFGPLAYTVLTHWNLNRSEDVGAMVYHMVEMRVLKTTETDSIHDFDNGYNFKETFSDPFLGKSKSSIKQKDLPNSHQKECS